MTTQELPYDIEQVIGDCYNINVIYKVGGVAVDLTQSGYSAYFRAWTDDGEVEFNIDSVASPTDIFLGSDGSITGVVPASETADWPEGKKVRYRLHIVQPSGCLLTLLRGFFKTRY